MSAEAVRLTLDKPVYGGDCLARLDRKAVFVPLTLPGETVSARIVESRKGFSRAEVEAVLTPSPDRIAPACPHFGACGGCHLQHASYPAQLALKRQVLRDTLTRAGVALPANIDTLAGEPWGYRNRIRLEVTPTSEMGYRGRKSHEIIPITKCPIAAPLLVETALQLAPLLAGAPAPIPELELFTNPGGSGLLVTLFCSTEAANAGLWLADVAARLPRITGLRLHMGDGGLNPRILAQTGASALAYSAGGFPYRVEHGAFFQVNRFLADRFVAAVTGGHHGQLAWDLYAGVGLFARPLTAQFGQVLAVESAEASFAGLRENLAGTSGTAIGSTTLDFLRRNRVQREARPDLIVLDPPRAGLGEQTCTLLNAIHAPRMTYVSCDPATLARDLHQLTQERFRLDAVTMVDMFPQTYHLETIATLTRC